MLLPMLREDLFDRLNEYGIDMGVGKPIIPSILLNGILDIFNLKAISASQPIKNKDASPAKFDKTHRVLLAEDNKTNRLIEKSLLQQVEIESIVACDGREAVELFKEHKDSIDLILMDLHMPVMNGYEAAQEIRKISADVPIVAMTADVILGVREKCEQSGIHHYISKPFDPEHFIQTIKEIISENENNKIQNVSVLDQSAGLKNMGDNAEIYRQVLNEYLSENQHIADKLSSAVLEKRYADAAQIVHKVKSSSGSIGAKSLYDAAITLQKALNEEKEDEITLLLEKFSRLLRELLEEIKEFQS
jgi:CheY-like chemotaxis protein